METPNASTAETLATEALAPHPRRQRRPGDIINMNTAALPDRQRNAIRRLHAYGDEQEMTNKQLGDFIGYSEATISRIYGEKLSYGGNLDEVAAAIEKALDQAAAAKATNEILSLGRPPFTETNLSRHIFSLGKAAVDYQRIVFMYGESQIGKTRNLKELAARMGGNAVYMEMPVGGAVCNFLSNGAEAVRVNTRKKGSELRRRFIDAFDGKMLLIIDQMHRAFQEGTNNSQQKTLDFIIELFDAKFPGILLSGTKVFREGMDDKVYKGFFSQLRRRGLNTDGFQLDPLPSDQDLAIFAHSYGLPPANSEALKLQSKIVGADGLGVWLTRLTSARVAAAKRKRPMTWDEVQRAHDFFTDMSLVKVAAPVALKGAA